MRIFIFFLISCVLVACSSAPPAPDPKITKPFLWKLDKDGKTSYLLGTFHLGIAFSDLPPIVTAHLSETKLLGGTVVTEADLVTKKKDVDPVQTREMMDRMILPRGQSLDQMISPEAWAKLKETVHGQIPDDKLKHYSAQFVLTLIGLQKLKQDKFLAEVKKHPEWLKKRMDLALQLYTVKQGYHVAYLENTDMILDIFSKHATPARLEKYLLHPPEAHSEVTMEEMMARYRSGSLEAVGVEIAQMGSEAKEMFFEERNHIWADEIGQMQIDKGPLFIAVGMGHMVGAEQSLIHKLEALGFKIERVP